MKNRKKIFIACVAMISVIILNVLSVFAVEDGAIKTFDDGRISQYFADISTYRDSTFTVEREGEDGKIETVTYYDNEVPTPEGYDGYIFAGWYTDQACTTTLGSDVTDDSAYAKFVPKQILGIKAQIEANTGFGTESSSIRFVTSVDTLKYQAVGFDFEINGKKLNAESDSVYKRLEAKGADDRVLNYTPSALFHTMSSYFMACTVTNVQNADFGHGIFVTPYWITNDGTKVYSDQDMRTINMGYMPYATDVTASLATSDDGIERPNDAQASSQGGCTDGTYYYQAILCDDTSVTADNAAATGTTKIQRYEMENGKWVLDSASSSLLPLAHANDMTYNPNLTYSGQSGTGLLVVCQNEPVWKRVSFVDPSTLDIVAPSEVTTLDGTSKGWNTESTELQYMELTMDGTGIFSIDYNVAYDRYVVGLAGTKNFCILDSSMQVVGEVKTTNNVPAEFVNQGVGSDDSYIYFVYYHNPNSPVEGYSTHIIAVYDWDGNAVTVMDISADSIAVGASSSTTYEPENISILDNTIYVGCSRWVPIVADNETFIFKVDSTGMTIDYPDSVAEITRSDETFGYFTLEDAMADAQKGETINLLTDVTVDSTMEMLAEDVTLTTSVDNGVTITRNTDITLIDVAESGSLTIDGKVTLDGNGDVISGTSNFIRNAGSLTLGTTTTVQNVTCESGRAILSESGSLKLQGTLLNNTATGKGGAVRVNGGKLQVDGARFEKNIAKYGGAIFVEGADTEVQVENVVLIENGTISSGYGGALYFDGVLNATVSNSNFTSNSCEYDLDTSDLGGGALFLTNSAEVALKECTFESNKAKEDGGAIQCRNASLEATECTFKNNSSENGNGAIYNKTKSVSLMDCTFENDTVINTNGGITTVSGDTNGATFVYFLETENSVEIGDTGLTGSITISPASYKTDYVAVGGAVADSCKNINITDNEGYPYEVTAEGYLALKGELKNAEAAISPEQYGTLEDMIGAANEDASATLDNPVVITVLQQDISVSETLNVTGYVKLTTIKDNDVTIKRTMADNLFLIATSDSAGKGGLEIDGVITLDGNKAEVEPGEGIYFIRCYGERFTLGSEAIIQNHNGGSWGGAVRGQAGTINLYGTLQDNESTGKGSAVRAEDCVMNIVGATFKNNSGKYGGAIYAKNTKVTIDDAEFTNNTANYRSGAIDLEQIVSDAEFIPKISNSTFAENKSNDESSSNNQGGGAITLLSTTLLELENNTFSKNKTTKYSGGAVTAYKSSIKIVDCDFINNTATKNAGAVYVYGESTTKSATGTITGGSFSENTANNIGGALYEQYADFILKDVSFTNNSAPKGSAIYLPGNGTSNDIVLENLTFTNNTATTDGSTIYNNGRALSVTDCVFTGGGTISHVNDTSISKFAGIIKGATIVQTVSPTNTSVVIDSNGLDRGSQIKIQPYSSDYIVDKEVLMIEGDLSDTQIKEKLTDVANTTDIIQPDGAEVYWYIESDGKLATTTAVSTFDALKSAIPTEGSATIYLAEDIEITESLTIANGVNVTLKGKNGVRLYRTSTINMFTIGDETNGGGSLTVDGAIILDGNEDVVGKSGGNLVASYGTFTLGRNAVIKDVRYTAGKRRAIYGYDTSVINLYGTISGCTSNGDGAGVKMSEAGGNLNVDGAIFENNSSDSYGATISLNAIGIKATIKNATFKNNTSKDTGGAAIYSKSDLTVNGGTFENNSGVSGGAIYLTSDVTTATITDTTFTDNESTATASSASVLGGGAIYSEAKTLALADNTFSNNKSAKGYGGAVHVNAGTLTVNGGQFEQNSSLPGGAIYLNTDTTATIENATFINNESNGTGGGAIYSKARTLTLNQNTFTGNETSSVGGAIRVAAGTLTIDGGSFEKNVSTQGGAIYVKGATAEIKNATFSSNESTNAGGGAVYSEGELTLNGNTFTNNIADTYGGAVHCQKANISVTACSFGMNQAGEYGGAIRANGESGANITVTIGGGTFNANEAISYHGGALSVNYVESLTVDGTSSFTANKASKGTAIHIGSTLVSKTIDENCTFGDGQTTYSEAETSN